MRSKAVFHGHPLHPMLIPFPFAFLTGAVVFDAAGWALERPSWWATGGYLALVGVATALVAAVPGFIDYFYTVPPDSSGRTRATRHMLVNLTAVGLFTAALLVRPSVTAAPTAWSFGLAVVGLGFLISGGWMGGTLVYRNQIAIDHRYANAGKWKEERFDRHDGPIAVARADELKIDQMKLLRLGSRRVVLARTERGYLAFGDRCTHKGGSLAGGLLGCGVVHCPWHGSQFNVRNGDAVAGPAQEPIPTYTVREQDGRIFLLL